MPRTILYYPSIAIRNPRWIRQMIFYWDAIATIVPHDLEKAAYASKDIKELDKAGLFHIYYPENRVMKASDLAEEFMTLYNNAKLPKIDPATFDSKRDGYSVYYKKMPDELREAFIREGIGKYSRDDEWIELSRETGLAYMSLLAKYLANERSRGEWITTPGTDYGSYTDIILKSRTEDKSIPGLSFVMQNVLPYPREDVEIDAILSFKKDMNAELLEFRKKIYEYQDVLRKEVRDETDLHESLHRFSEDITGGLKKIQMEAEKAKVATERGTVETILAAGETPLIKALEKVLPPPLPLAGQIATGIFSVRSYRLNQKNLLQEKLMESSFSYVYHAQQRGII